MKINKYISPIAIILGFLWLVVGIVTIIMNTHAWSVDNGFVGIIAGVGYLGFGCILRYTKDYKTIFISIVGLILLTASFILLPIVKGEGVRLELLTIAFLALLSFDLGRIRKLHF